MQPPLLIDWLRQLHLAADAVLAAKRWKVAEAFAVKVTRKEVVQLLRAFLFPAAVAQHLEGLTEQLLLLDSEFPASNNTEEVRLMAGIVMVAAVQKRPELADAFALGIKAAAFPSHRCNPVQRGIVDEMGKYLEMEANNLRPSDFNASGDSEDTVQKLEAFAEAVVKNEPASTKNACEDLATVFDETYGRRLQRLAEESGLLWWMLGGYSSTLSQEVAGISPESYALVAAEEAAVRTQLLPPPPCIYAILGRALAHCKGPKRKNSTLKDIVVATDTQWRTKFVTTHSATDCADLVPMVTALAKLEDSGDTTTLAKALQRACPGVSIDLALPPAEAAQQLYNELVFLKALTAFN